MNPGLWQADFGGTATSHEAWTTTTTSSTVFQFGPPQYRRVYEFQYSPPTAISAPEPEPDEFGWLRRRVREVEWRP